MTESCNCRRRVVIVLMVYVRVAVIEMLFGQIHLRNINERFADRALTILVFPLLSHQLYFTSTLHISLEYLISFLTTLDTQMKFIFLKWGNLDSVSPAARLPLYSSIPEVPSLL